MNVQNFICKRGEISYLTKALKGKHEERKQVGIDVLYVPLKAREIQACAMSVT